MTSMIRNRWLVSLKPDGPEFSIEAKEGFGSTFSIFINGESVVVDIDSFNEWAKKINANF